MADSTSAVAVLAPLSGIRVALERVPDPVFAQRIVGDGCSLDPVSGTLLAPIDGRVVQLHGSRHALTLRSPAGIDLLLHIGVDTVGLRGEGFEALVAEGEEVRAGQPLIRFDIDGVAQRARSLLTQVLVANVDAIERIELGRGALEAGGSVLFRVFPKSASTGAPVGGDAAAGELLVSDPLPLPNPAGLHARPAAVLAERARAFDCPIFLLLGERRGNARSVVEIMALGSRQGDALRIEARGPAATSAIETLSALIRQGCGEDLEAAAAQLAAMTAAASQPAASSRREPGVLVGVTASPGMALGAVARWRRAAPRIVDQAGAPEAEREKLTKALDEVRRRLARLGSAAHDAARSGVLGAQQGMLDDPGLAEKAEEGIAAGLSAGRAWQAAVEKQAGVLEALDNPLMRERAADLRDVGAAVLRAFSGEVEQPAELPEGCILVAEDLTPSETAQLDVSRVRGLCTTGGGPTGHVAILARSLGLPALCGVDAGVLDLPEGSEVLLDASAGRLLSAPDDGQREAARAAIERARQRQASMQAAAARPAHSRCGARILVVANVRHAGDAREALAAGAEGVGLLRSEFLFDARDSAPDEAEQAAAYAEVAEALGPQRPLVIRTLDVGGDKPLPYLPLPREDNPFLGLRGIRVSLAHPELFRVQLRALLRGAGQGDLHLMLPMVAGVEELREARTLLQREADALGVAAPKLGVMIEVPSAALTADALAAEADFFSIGSNDLTQYTLAMDRGHARLAAQADALHPAVLRLVGMTAEAGSRHGRWVGVCGAIAADPLAVPALLGLGVTELSVPAPAVAATKATVAAQSLEDCRALAAELLRLGTAAEVRARLADWEAAHAM
ncbi:phosphoenolpyruvate--protein phosphotransferase [Pseudomarimonas salicorniae]|uniref:phosphoenolpyruvate--protein phosphotransferase n=1 Tax=Pseudomarimonas salicorniae TaxID=2933270 RepID=A0ABT0GEN7_9GAMM|nr:phosphoenolpyruvate--protein phosphotransferase [Lysobacter sp. CAU 1642]MCK7592817.1 phosphoenolpyruvate--protein phosphotransferase [Lysobacter sp. CAU 1642]